jgi:hypothetical protein
MSESVPKFLYRGVKLSAVSYEEDGLSGADLELPYEPFIDELGRKTVRDGNEYGIYMTDYEKMALDIYGNPQNDGTPINNNLFVGIDRKSINIPSVGIVYTINTEGLDIREPWISDVLSGVYNNGYVGKEWITDRIPKDNYQITRIRIGNDLLNQSIDIPLTSDIYQQKVEIRRELNQRKMGLLLFIKQLEKMTPNQRLFIDITKIEVYKSLFGSKGVHFRDIDDFDISSYLGKIEYLTYLIYHDNTEDINISALNYLQQIKKIKIMKEDNPDLEQIVQHDLDEVKNSKDRFIKIKQASQEPYSTGVFDKKISMLTDILKNIMQKINKNNIGIDERTF